MQVLGLDLKAAAARLNADFNLGLDREPTAAERDAARRALEAKRMFTDWRDTFLNQLDAAIRVANLADPADMTDAEALAIQNRERLEYVAEILQHRPLTEQMAVFRERGALEGLCQKIIQTSQAKSRTA